MPSPTFIPAIQSSEYGQLEEKIRKLEKVSGYNIDKLISMFATGYVLVCTEPKITVSYDSDFTFKATFANKSRAESALEQLNQLIDLYGFATISDAKDICGVASSFSDTKDGWNDLSKAVIEEGPNDTVLSLPRAVRID